LLKLQEENSSIDILQINATRLPFKNKKFECILSIQTAGLLDLHNYLRECNRILTIGGWLLFNEANRNSYKAIIQKKISKESIFYRYSYAEICFLLEKNNFTINKTIGMNWLPIKRCSNNQFIKPAAVLENTLKLRTLPSISPWVFYIARKNQDI